MEIPEDKPTTRISLPSLLSLIFILLVISVWLIWPSDNSNGVVIGYVEEGRIAEKVPVFGRLRAEVERSIIPKISGSVVSKNVRPGDRVSQDTVIIDLSNIKVDQEFVEAKMAVMSAAANIKELQSELLGQHRKLKNNLALLNSKRDLAQVELTAKEKLNRQNIISDLDLKKAQLAFQQSQLEAQLAQDELKDFDELSQARQSVSKARLEQAKARLDVAQANRDSLQITAQMQGVVQSLNNDIKVGQWLDSGTSLGSVAKTDKLYAEVKVMASFASSLEKCQSVTLDIKGETVQGQVTHIEPNVIDNQIQIYVTPTSSLPSTARLNIEVTGQIIVFDKAALVMTKPDYLQEGVTKQAIWVVDQAGEVARREVELGLVTKEQIEIIAGLTVGEQVALSLDGNTHEQN